MSPLDFDFADQKTEMARPYFLLRLSQGWNPDIKLCWAFIWSLEEETGRNYFLAEIGLLFQFPVLPACITLQVILHPQSSLETLYQA